MYGAWTWLHLGIGLALNSVWMIGVLAVVVLITYFVDIRREEHTHEQQFELEYLE